MTAKRLIIISVLLLGVIATSYDRERKHNVSDIEINKSLNDLKISLDSLKTALDERN